MSTGSSPRKDEREVPWSPAALADPHAQADKARRVQAMFDAIARRYDRANTVISLGQDRRWRKALVRMVGERGMEPGRVLDLCCGTGAMARHLQERYPNARVLGADFSIDMLRCFVRHGLEDDAQPAGKKTRPGEPAVAHPILRESIRNNAYRLKDMPVACLAADALSMPFVSGAFDLVTCVFGLRNFQSLETGLAEIRRVLRPGGVFAALEFQPPRGGLTGLVFNFYFHHVLPILGAAATGGGRTGAYEYLPRSVESWYPGSCMVELMQQTGFQDIRVRKLCLDAVWALTAVV